MSSEVTTILIFLLPATTMVTNTTLLLIFVTLASVTAQTFQYSRGWTNGKRDGHKRTEDLREIANNIDKILSPCQINKLKYILEGKPVTERVCTCFYLNRYLM